MVVYVVTEFYADYSQSMWRVKAVFATRELAEDYAAKMAALPGLPFEYGPGERNEYEILEMEVWDTPTERLMLYHKHAYINPMNEASNGPTSYRTEEYTPPGYTGFWHSNREWEPETGWSRINVTAPTAEARDAEFARLWAQNKTDGK